jgi:predicted anti-sigma-YlaC factor YlaD
VTDPRAKPADDQSRALDREQPRGLPVEQPHASDSGRTERLEQFVAGLARSQPPRRAPASLEARVFAQISAQPWWRKGFVHWPVWARAAFLVASVGFVRLALAGVISLTNLVSTADVADVDTFHRTGQAVSTTVSLGELLFHAIPPVWLYAGAVVGFTLYAVLFGLGTFAYRTLYVQR